MNYTIYSCLCFIITFSCLLYAYYLAFCRATRWYERGREHGRREEQSHSFRLIEKVKDLETKLAQEQDRYKTADMYRNVFSTNMKEIERLRIYERFYQAFAELVAVSVSDPAARRPEVEALLNTIKENQTLRSHVAVLADECKVWRELASLPEDCDRIDDCINATDALNIPEMKP